MNRYTLTLARVPTAAGEVHFPTDDLRLVLDEGDPELTLTWQLLMAAATRGEKGPFSATELHEQQVAGGGEARPASGGQHPTAGALEKKLEKLVTLGIARVESVD
jgi:hypothetical protein